MFRIAALLLLLAMAASPVRAETVYVDDTLRVGVRNNPGNTETPVEVLISGASLEVLERGDKGYMRVRTVSGAEGWVSSVYTTTEPPARLLLEQAKQENARLQNELRTLRGGTQAAAAAPAPISSEADELRKENALLVARLSEISNQGLIGDRNAWIIEALVLIVLFTFGIFLGKRHERQRVASRFNGLEL